MSIMLGNLNLKQIQDRCGMTFPQDTVKYLNKIHSESADVPKGMWHGFDIPFCIFCGDIETAKKIRDSLSILDWSKCKECLTIQYSQERKEE